MFSLAPRKFFVSLAVAVLVSLSCPALARPEMAGQDAASRFSAMDTDKDGKVSREEFFAAQPQMKEAAFTAIDADKDGYITLEEWEGFAKGHGHGGDMPPRDDGAEAGSAGGGKTAPALIMPPDRQ